MYCQQIKKSPQYHAAVIFVYRFTGAGKTVKALASPPARPAWIKNEIVKDIPKYINESICVGRKKSDTTHNTNKKTKRLKEHTDYFYYFQTTLPNESVVYLHLGKYNAKKIGKEGIMYLYSVTKKLPKNIEVL